MMRHTSRGIALIEVVVALSIISIALVALLVNYKAHLKAALSNTQAVKASYLVEEGFEAVRFLRDGSWSRNIQTLTAGTAYSLYWNGTVWLATTTPQYVDEFQRTFSVAAVSRDGNSDIVSSGGTVDPDTKRVDVSVAWSTAAGTTTKTVSTYLTNLFNN